MSHTPAVSGELLVTLLSISNKGHLRWPEQRAISTRVGRPARVRFCKCCLFYRFLYKEWGDKGKQCNEVLYLSFFSFWSPVEPHVVPRAVIYKAAAGIHLKWNNVASIQELIYVFNKAPQLLVPPCPHFTPIFLTAAVRKEVASRVE